MEILPIKTPILRPGDDLAAALNHAMHFGNDDVIVVSSKAIAITENTSIDLGKLTSSPEANRWAKKCGRSPTFCQAVLNECARMNGFIAGASPHALLTLLKPAGRRAIFLVPNAGLDESNIESRFAVGWPADPVSSAEKLRQEILEKTGKRVATIVSDSCCWPTRLGVTAFALTACGIDPLRSEVGNVDLHGNTLLVTNEAIADQMATAANMVMGNAAQSSPAAIVRGHGQSITEFCGWVEGIDQEKDLFGPVLKIL